MNQNKLPIDHTITANSQKDREIDRTKNIALRLNEQEAIEERFLGMIWS